MPALRLCCRIVFVALLLSAPVGAAQAKARTFYVATNGDDRWSGTLPAANDQRTEGPLRSLSEAIKKSRRGRRHEAGHAQILLHTGTFTLAEPLVLTTEDSGLTVAACRHESPVISGQTLLRGWKCFTRNPNVWQTEIADVRNGNWIFHELFVNGQRKERTRVPETGFFRAAGPGIPGRPDELQFHTGDIKAEWALPGDVEVIAFEAWAQSRNQIRDVFAPSNIVSLAGGALPNTMEPNPRFFIENAPVDLRPGQWHLDLHSGLLTYWPEAGEDVPKATITAPHLYDLVQIEGDAANPAYDITFRGITFADTDWRLDGGSDSDTQAAAETPGAIQLQFARDCAFEQCNFQRLGGYALELGRGCKRDKIIGNEMHDLGAGGIRVGDIEMAEAIPHPCGGHIITDNHIHHIGLVNAPAVGILIMLSGQNQIAHNEIDHTFYTAISVGWTWGYGESPCQDNKVEFNHLHDLGQGMLSDMGGVYTLGIQPGTVVRNNLIHDVNVSVYGGWGLYTDEGSSGIVFESNVVYRCQSAGFHQHYGQANFIRNNIFAFNKEAELARTRIVTGTSFTFTNNIIYFDSGWLFSGNWGDDLEMDCNIYFDTRSTNGNRQALEALRAWQKHGHDQHSLFVDPMFVSPRRDNFRLKPNSPALRLGFRQIDLSTVGVRDKFRQP